MKTKLDIEKEKLDKALKIIGFSSKTKSLWTYFKMGEESIKVARYGFMRKQSVLGIAKQEGVPKGIQKAFALYYLNQVLNGTTKPHYKTTRKETLQKWKKAVSIVEKMKQEVISHEKNAESGYEMGNSTKMDDYS